MKVSNYSLGRSALLACLLGVMAGGLFGQATDPATRPASSTAAATAPVALDSPEAALHEFLVAVVLCDKERINNCTIEVDGREILSQNSSVSMVDRVAMASTFSEITFRRLKLGETFVLPGNRALKMTEDRVNDDTQQLTFADNPVPFQVLRVGKEWKVDPGSLIAARKAVAAVKARRAATRAKVASRPAD